MHLLLPLLSRFHRRYRGVTILTLAVILLSMWAPLPARASDADRHYAMGLRLLADKGETSATSHATANIWFTMAAMRGHDGAQFHLGVSFAKGRGTHRNLKAAVHFYQLAAAQNHATAQYNLAVMYSNGTGVKRDHEKALALLLIARGRPGLNAAAHQQINALMTVLRTNLNSTQISRAEWHAAQVMGATL